MVCSIKVIFINISSVFFVDKIKVFVAMLQRLLLFIANHFRLKNIRRKTKKKCIKSVEASP